MCRGLYAIRFGERLSKPAAAVWAQQAFPQWATGPRVQVAVCRDLRR
jgi:hypothetical protein